MIVEWIPKWYELDQCIVTGEVDLFYLTNDNRFADGFEEDDYEVKAEIVAISHAQLGRVKGIITIGLDYTIYLWDGSILYVNAEEAPGEIENGTFDIKEWKFDVDMKIIEKTGFNWRERFTMMEQYERKAFHKQRIENYKRLLGITGAEWESEK